ncbi:MAG: hypothetical protein ACR2N8_05465 [Parvibaculales bacterium]
MDAKLKLKINDISLFVSGSEGFVIKARDDFEKKYFPNGINLSQSQAKPSPEQPSGGGEGIGFDSYESKAGIDSNAKGQKLISLAGCWLSIEKDKRTFSDSDVKEVIKAGNLYTHSKHITNFATLIKNLVRNGIFVSRGGGSYAVDPKEVERIRGIVYGE